MCTRVLLLALLAGCSSGGLEVGGSVQGELSDNDLEVHLGQPVDQIVVTLEGGEPVVVLVSSSEFRPFLIVTSQEAPFGISADDDTGLGACLALEVPTSEEVVIYVSSAEAHSRGRYQVDLQPYSAAFAQAHGCGALEGGPGPTLTASSSLDGD